MHAQYGIQHFTWLCINAKEAENVELSREVLKLIPEFLDCSNVLGIGEIGLNKNTRNEAIVFQEHLELAIAHDQQVLIHTPHLEDKYQGTRMILDMLADHSIDRTRVLVDHVEEHTVGPVLEAGYWAGMTLYPVTKCTPSRAVDIIERHGSDRLCVNSAGDWGPSKPTGGSRSDSRNASSRTRRKLDSQNRLRQSADVFQSKQKFSPSRSGDPRRCPLKIWTGGGRFLKNSTRENETDVRLRV